MPARLRPCLSCARHVRSDETHCPFCGHAIPEAPSVQVAPPALSRAGYSVLVAGAAMLVVGCDSAPVAAYGGPPPVVPSAQVPEAVDAGAAADAGGRSQTPPKPDLGNLAPAYGGAPPPMPSAPRKP